MLEGVSPSPLLSFLWLQLHVVTTQIINRSMAHRQLIMQRRQQIKEKDQATLIAQIKDEARLLVAVGAKDLLLEVDHSFSE
jgi:hypothetical protein